ncbi:MAG TPA: tRNA (adenosine(37)-N6)-threonylcarbamoyltransferase complex dimerization subunit type 1 TsaB [Acidobacteriaceae bacterium]|nr:tRNA (adenosine(37)-N6)-threonylcarbamoyltransferase complex dimerization subunit type 1 TsaB [Acidobacteriaceae bacterium]
MKLLLIDTCGTEGSVAIADAGCDPADTVSTTLPGRSASEKLVAAVRELARESGIELRELGAIAIVNGPGSFTGVRVGLSAAKGFCEALNVPLILISRLAVLASASAAGPETHAFAVLDAGRQEFYVGEYLGGARLDEALVPHDELRSRILRAANRALMVCEESVAGALSEFAPRMVAEPSAVSSLPLVLERIRRSSFDDVVSADANYLRRTDLEIFAKVRAQAALAGRP